MVIQNLRKEDYYIQRNNQLYPSEACMPTARAMFYKGNNILTVNPSVFEDDDYFMSIMRSAAAEATKERKYHWADTIPANEVHGMYHTFLDYVVVGKRVSDFIELTFHDYIHRIRNGECIMTSIAAGGLTGHAVVFTGYDQLTEELLIADPYGDYHTDYRDHNGYGVRMGSAAFMEYVKPIGALHKWAHVIGG